MNEKDELIKINEEFSKATFTCKYLTWERCPTCGSKIEQYRYISKWRERIDFECGLTIESHTPLYMSIEGTCKNSTEFKQRKEQRLKELQEILNAVEKNVKDERLFRELMGQLGMIESNIKSWWNK